MSIETSEIAQDANDQPEQVWLGRPSSAPWQIHTPENPYGWSRNYPDTVFMIEIGPGDYGGFIVCGHNAGTHETSWPPINPLDNALLIAAAPELFAACKALIAAWESDSDNRFRPEPLHLTLARDAVAIVDDLAIVINPGSTKEMQRSGRRRLSPRPHLTPSKRRAAAKAAQRRLTMNRDRPA